MNETGPSAQLLRRLMSRRARQQCRREAEAMPYVNRLTRAMRLARNQNRNDKNLLRRTAPKDREAWVALNDLEACMPEHLCDSRACAKCNTLLEDVVTPLILDAYRRSNEPWYCVTIIGTRPTIPCGELETHVLFDGFEEALHGFFAAEGGRAIGSLEISNNEHHADAYRPRYVEHAHLFTTMKFTRARRRRLKEIFPVTKGVKRPIMARRFDGRPGAISYAFKPESWRRDDIRRNRADGSRSSYSTRKKPMRSAERVEVAKAMNAFSPTRCVFMHGYSLGMTPDGPTITSDEHY